MLQVELAVCAKALNMAQHEQSLETRVARTSDEGGQPLIAGSEEVRWKAGDFHRPRKHRGSLAGSGDGCHLTEYLSCIPENRKWKGGWSNPGASHLHGHHP